MDGIVFVELSAVFLAVVGALAALFGADTRDQMVDTRETHTVKRNV